MSARPGAPIRVAMTKWDRRRHWEFDGIFLGADEHGTWLGFPRGTAHRRPGLAYESEVDSVTLLPATGWWLATFHAPGIWCELYVDIATPPQWDGHVVRSVDLDLDVIRRSGDHPTPRSMPKVYVDDEDEFLEHQATLEYPIDVIRTAEQAAGQVRAMVETGTAPFDDSTSADWLSLLLTLTT